MMTRADVEHFLAEHPNPLPRGAAVIGPPPTITRLELISRQQAQELLGGGAVGVSTDTPVWYVELRGTFSGEGLSRPRPRSAKVRGDHRYDTAAVVFDASTKKELVRAIWRKG